MLEVIAELLVAILDLFLISSSSKKKRYRKIDKIIENWAKKLGLYLKTSYKDEKVRSLSVVDDCGNSYQIWIENLKWRQLKVSVSNNQSGRKHKFWKKKCKTSNLTKVLYEAYGITEEWISENGNKRTIK